MDAGMTRLLNALESGDPHAADELLPLVYAELRQVAAAKLSREPTGQTLQATALVHEAWLRLAGAEAQHWDNRRHFFAAAAEAMRRILVDRARRRLRIRHGGDLQRVDLEDVDVPNVGPDERLLAVDEALTRLEQEDPKKAQVVKLRYFVGMTSQETADAMGVSLSTVERHWSFAKAWLFSQLKS